MRRRYSHFLSVVYKQCEASTGSGQEDIFVQSTDCDHTLMSAQASLAGLYPPTQDQIWNPRILWQPIPVHTMPLSQDNLLYLPFSHCPKYKELLRETFATRDFQRQFKHYKQFLKFLATHTGYPLKKLTSERIWKLSDTLQYEDINNYTLPVWATHGVRTKLIKLSELLLQAEFGHLIKGFLCSQHAATIAALQMALNVFNGKLPPHSACHFFELYQEKNGQVSASCTANMHEVIHRFISVPLKEEFSLSSCWSYKVFLSSSVRMGVIRLPSLSRILCFTFHMILILLQQTITARELKFVVVVSIFVLCFVVGNSGTELHLDKKQLTKGVFIAYIVQLFRHGDRTPIVNFPTDLHKESEWPQGFGQLTKTGMQQLFELGQYMRKRYSIFLNSTYNRKEFYIQSTDYDRTIMSAQSYLSGLFPPTSSQIWNPELLWQPIPVHIFQKTAEQRLNFPLPNCPRFDELQHETQTSKEFQSRIQPYMHDTTVGALQIALNIFNGKLPPYAACQFFELYQESNGQCMYALKDRKKRQYSIEMHYRNDTSKDPYLLTLPGCTSSCPLEKFAELVSPVITENWSKECGKKDKMKGSL
ncbi:Prostatic acid phosphatase [Lonchura striata]|uniref:acid phosphatase n=1 Tax=Lonchura striata TaxID=40157 RepID=A0A218UNM9_9PASE|nr:Prostatic acid phosphatase [Lonchura striata domestica]